MALHVADGKIINQVIKSIPSIPQTHSKSTCADVLMTTDSVGFILNPTHMNDSLTTHLKRT